MMQDLVAIGRIGKSHGLKGELKVRIEDAYQDDFLATKSVFISIKGRPIPYFIEKVRGGGTLILKLEGVDSPETAKLLKNGEVMLREADISSEAVEQDQGLEVLVDYQIFDQELGAVGTIIDVMEVQEQVLAEVNYQGRDLYIPLHPDLILSIDQDKQEILMDLPEGLLDL